MTDREISIASNSLVFLLCRQILKTPISSHSTAPYQFWSNTTFTIGASMVFCLNLGQRSTECILWFHVPWRPASVMIATHFSIHVVAVVVLNVINKGFGWFLWWETCTIVVWIHPLEDWATSKAIEAHGGVMWLPSNPTFEGYRLNGELLRVRKLHPDDGDEVGEHRVNWVMLKTLKTCWNSFFLCSSINFSPSKSALPFIPILASARFPTCALLLVYDYNYKESSI